MPEMENENIEGNYGEAVAENWDAMQDQASAPLTDLDAYSMAEVKARGQWGTAMRRFVRSPRAMFGVVVFFGVMVTSKIYTLMHPTQYYQLGTDLLKAPSSAHLFGTTVAGTDVFAMVMQGVLQDVEVAVVVALIAVVIGVLIGALAGFYGGWVDSLLMRFTDFVLVIPVLVILILLANKISGSSSNWFGLALLIGMLSWTYLARLVRANFLQLRELEFVEASRALGASDWRIVSRHLLPNAIGPIVVNTTLIVAGAIGLEATLSFIGLGIHPPAVSLGLMIQQGEALADPFWWLFVPPCAFLLILILSVFFIGDGLSNALDPRKNRVRS
jgi:peptide/nickel transport system permease protein